MHTNGAVKQGRAPAVVLPPSTSRFVYPEEAVVHLHDPSDAAAYLLTHVFPPSEVFEQEELWVLLLTRKTRVTHRVMVYRGTLTVTTVRLAEVFREAIRFNAAAIVVAHCHPSGDPTPSAYDLTVTRQLVDVGDLLDIEVLDHLIVGEAGRWVALAGKGAIRGCW